MTEETRTCSSCKSFETCGTFQQMVRALNDLRKDPFQITHPEGPGPIAPWLARRCTKWVDENAKK